MNNIFEELNNKYDSSTSLSSFLFENIQDIIEFCNSNYKTIVSCRDYIDSFIQLKYNTIEGLNYQKNHNQAFISILLELCERLNLRSSMIIAYEISGKKNLNIGSRAQAALLFMHNVDSRITLVNRFENICQNLEIAIEFEDDNEKKSIATFLNYYSVVIDAGLDSAKQVQAKILTEIQNETYHFLQNENIATIANIELQDLAVAYIQIQNVIDKVLGKESIIKYVPDKIIEDYSLSKFIIETNTDYSRELLSVANNFDSIRSISVSHAGSQKISGRGVKILESEEELFGYFKSFGNMHKAKLLSAFEALPDIFDSKVSIIDWGCGQGFASMVFLEKYEVENVNHITLVEPSEIALKRAALHCKKYHPNISLKTICKKLDDLNANDLNSPQSNVTIHFFSNILDIDNYSQKYLIELVEKKQTGENYFVCVSPYIDAIKTERLESFKRHFENKCDSFELLLNIISTKNLSDNFWCCNNTYTQGNVNHGHYFNCNDFNECGCSNKWTRVIKVFKVNYSRPLIRVIKVFKVNLQ